MLLQLKTSWQINSFDEAAVIKSSEWLYCCIVGTKHRCFLSFLLFIFGDTVRESGCLDLKIGRILQENI